MGVLTFKSGEVHKEWWRFWKNHEFYDIYIFIYRSNAIFIPDISVVSYQNITWLEYKMELHEVDKAVKYVSRRLYGKSRVNGRGIFLPEMPSGIHMVFAKKLGESRNLLSKARIVVIVLPGTCAEDSEDCYSKQIALLNETISSGAAITKELLKKIVKSIDEENICVIANPEISKYKPWYPVGR